MGVFKKIVDDIETILCRERSLDEFVKTFSEETDSIIQNEKRNGNKYSGGRLYVECSGKKEFNCVFKLYFLTLKDEAIELSRERKGFSCGLLKKQDREELLDKRVIAYEIEEP